MPLVVEPWEYTHTHIHTQTHAYKHTHTQRAKDVMDKDNFKKPCSHAPAAHI